ncbi:DUF523 domain-containing protein [Romboutsia maritimum]|uniref:DUF523 domain-containing protein n=1 Tax=Romboutsia maritimum TaxID=2020948 RepID=A0A255I0Y8_9FIRM|nr:DUF523 domain-containing protein [Romboutsia maritimum]RDY24132.1 DUF523 domain-containing protein [Romboutsia maritimum]
MILVSACLLGINCKYNGDNNNSDKVREYLKDKQYIVVCPEQLGGLTTPRNPSEIEKLDGNAVLKDRSRVMTNENIDTTEQFLRGANETLKIAQLYGCREAILKESSPSCGSNCIHDGTFSGRKISGVGVTTALLKSKGIKVISEKEL